MRHNFSIALQYLTIFRLNKKHKIEENDLVKSMIFFPVVGFLIGLLLVNFDKFFTLIALPHTVSNLLLVALSVVITKALDVNGLANTLDTLTAGSGKHLRLSVAGDGKIGTAGIIGVFFILLMKYLCLNSLFNSEKVAALLIAPMLSRWSQTIMAFKSTFRQEAETNKTFVGHIRTGELIYISLIAVGLAGFVIIEEQMRAVFLICSLIIGVVLFTILGRRYFLARPDGISSDAVGAVSEMNEILVFLLFVIFAGVS